MVERSFTELKIEPSEFGKFMRISGPTENVLYVLETEADCKKSMRSLREAGLSPLWHQRPLGILKRDNALKDYFKGKWFWLAENGMSRYGLFGVGYGGNLTEAGASLEGNVFILGGKQPLLLDVFLDSRLSSNSRFGLNATAMLEYIAPVVVGVSKGATKFLRR